MAKSMEQHSWARPLTCAAPELEEILSGRDEPPTLFAAATISCESLTLTMRDGVHLATDLYRPPGSSAPAIAVRTPYGRNNPNIVAAATVFAQSGYIVIVQDCRGTGDSEPDTWDYYVYERG